MPRFLAHPWARYAGNNLVLHVGSHVGVGIMGSCSTVIAGNRRSCQFSDTPQFGVLPKKASLTELRICCVCITLWHANPATSNS